LIIKFEAMTFNFLKILKKLIIKQVKQELAEAIFIFQTIKKFNMNL